VDLPVAAAAQGLAVDCDRLWPRHPVGGGGRVVGEGGCCSVSHRPMTWSSPSGSTRASTRRTVAWPGGRQTRRSGSRRAPSAASTDPGASAAHSHGQHRAKRVRSAAALSWVSELGEVVEQTTALVGASAADTVSRRATAGMGDHERADTVIRSGHGI
jgi:hypothetical protein